MPRLPRPTRLPSNGGKGGPFGLRTGRLWAAGARVGTSSAPSAGPLRSRRGALQSADGLRARTAAAQQPSSNGGRSPSPRTPSARQERRHGTHGRRGCANRVGRGCTARGVASSPRGGIERWGGRAAGGVGHVAAGLSLAAGRAGLYLQRRQNRTVRRGHAAKGRGPGREGAAGSISGEQHCQGRGLLGLDGVSPGRRGRPLVTGDAGFDNIQAIFSTRKTHSQGDGFRAVLEGSSMGLPFWKTATYRASF